MAGTDTHMMGAVVGDHFRQRSETKRPLCTRHAGTIVAALCGGLLVASLSAQPSFPTADIPAEVLTLVRIQHRVRESLERLPNHTCRMDISRAHLSKKARAKVEKKLEKLRHSTVEGLTTFDIPLDSADSVALDVAVVDGKEIYAFPESSRFEDRPLEEMIGHGTVSTGAFAAHARDIFVNRVGTVDYVGEESLDGQQAQRYDYEVALFRSGYSVTNKGRSATVPYHGSFWATVDGDELLRLTVLADDIPLSVGVDKFATQIDYQTLHLGSKPFIVPQRTRLSMLLSTGVESVNETRFTDCRSFVGSSTLSFDDSTARFYVTKTEKIENVEVPIDLSLSVRLTTLIDSETAGVGTPIEAVLARDVPFGTDSVLPKGALLRGRLRRFEYYGGDDEHHVVGIEFQELTFNGKRAIVSLSLEQIANALGVQRGPPAPTTSRFGTGGIGNMPTVTRRTVETYYGQDIPGVGVFYVRKKTFRLKPGLKMTWRTGPTSSAPEK